MATSCLQVATGKITGYGKVGPKQDSLFWPGRWELSHIITATSLETPSKSLWPTILKFNSTVTVKTINLSWRPDKWETVRKEIARLMVDTHHTPPTVKSSNIQDFCKGLYYSIKYFENLPIILHYENMQEIYGPCIFFYYLTGPKVMGWFSKKNCDVCNVCFMAVCPPPQPQP